jgi:hypothetical protein
MLPIKQNCPLNAGMAQQAGQAAEAAQLDETNAR